MPHLTLWFMLLFVGPSLLMLGVSVPLVLGKIAPNSTWIQRYVKTLLSH